VAGALEQDSTVITLIDPLTYEPLVQFKSNKISVADTCTLINKLVTTYFPSAIIIPERNNMGIALIQDLLKTPVARNMYYEIKEKVVEEEDQNSNFKIGKMGDHRKKNDKKKKQTRIYGINTTPKSREYMYKEILNTIVTEKPELVNNLNFYNEIRTLVRDKKGKIQADAGFHDDVVMSYLIGMYAMLYGNTRKKFFVTIQKSEILENLLNGKVNKKMSNNARRFNNMLNGKDTNQFKYLNGKVYEEAVKMERENRTKKNTDSIHKEHNADMVKKFNRMKSLF
jgi:hypothetical protein